MTKLPMTFWPSLVTAIRAVNVSLAVLSVANSGNSTAKASNALWNLSLYQPAPDDSGFSNSNKTS